MANAKWMHSTAALWDHGHSNGRPDSSGWRGIGGSGPGGMIRGRNHAALRGCDRKHITGIPSFSGQDAPETKPYQHNAFAVYGHKPASLFALPVAIPGVASLRSSAKGSKSAPPYMKSVSAKSLKSLSPTGMKSKKRYLESTVVDRLERGLDVSAEEESLTIQLTAWRRKEKEDDAIEQGKGRVNRHTLARREIITLEKELRKWQAKKATEQVAVKTRETRLLIGNGASNKAAADHRAALPSVLKEKAQKRVQIAEDEHHTPHHKIGQMIIKSISKGRQIFSHTISDVEEMFSAIDHDHNTGVDMDELREGMERLGVWMGPYQVVEIFNHIDTDGDGQITKDEFVAFLKDCKGDEVEKTPDPREMDLCQRIEDIKAERVATPFMVAGTNSIEGVMALNAKLRDLREDLARLIGIGAKPKALGRSKTAGTLVKHKKDFSLDTRAAQDHRMGLRQPPEPITLINPRGRAGRHRSFVSDKELRTARISAVQQKSRNRRQSKPSAMPSRPMTSSEPLLVLAYGAL